MYKISVRALAIDWLFVYHFPKGAGEVILEPLVDVEEAISKQYHEGIYSIEAIICHLYSTHTDSISDFLLLQNADEIDCNKALLNIR